MYNIVISKGRDVEREVGFLNGADDKPRQYPTLAEALVSAQYLGLTRQDVELHFVREGAHTAGLITETATANTTQRDGDDSGDGTGKALDKMKKAELVAYATGKGIAVNDGDTKETILAAIKEAEKRDLEPNDATQGNGDDSSGDNQE